jgi:hypothetical protein
MDISARAVLLADRPRMGHLGHQCLHAPVRPILHLVSSSRRPRRETDCRGHVIDRSLSLCSSFVPLYAVPLFVPEARSFVPALRMCWRATRKGPSRLAVAFALPLAPASPGHALTGPSTARHSSSSGRHAPLRRSPPHRGSHSSVLCCTDGRISPALVERRGQALAVCD